KSCRQMNSSLGGNCNTNDHPRWNYHSTHYGTDDYGFSAFPGGYRNNAGPFFGMGISGYFWSSSECTSAGAWVRNLNICYGNIQVCSNLKQNGYSIRCLRDN
ncbi:MAG: FISUMP domain-containing protein, partial [Bacteroidales bacterium]